MREKLIFVFLLLGVSAAFAEPAFMEQYSQEWAAGTNKQETLTNAVDMAFKTLDLVAVKKPDVSAKYAGKLADLRKNAEAAADDGAREKLFMETRCLRREILLSHPGFNFDKLLVNQRGALVGHQCDQYNGRCARPAEGLAIMENWKIEPKITRILNDKLPEPGMVLHPDISFDGQKILFSHCDATDKRRQFWRYSIYEAAVDGSWLRRITNTEKDIRETWYDRQSVLVEDYDPCYLPDDKSFIFISTRCQLYGRCHGARYVPSYQLHSANLDGSNISQISWGEANEWDPEVLNDGQIVYTRWDYINRHDCKFQDLWTTRPDGTNVKNYYGNVTASPQRIAETRPIPGSGKVVAVGGGHHAFTCGSLMIIDTAKGEEGPEPVFRLTPELGYPETEVPAHEGLFCSPWPIDENFFFIAKRTKGGDCGDYAIYIADTLLGRELIYKDPSGKGYLAPIPIKPRFKPPVLPSTLPDKEIVEKDKINTGVFYIQNVYLNRYDKKGEIKPGSIKSMRINEIIGQPTRSVTHRGRVSDEITKKVLGTVPVNPDGSVIFEAPARIPMQFQLLDENGMAVMTMRSFVYLQPGEQASCIGCHEEPGSAPPTGPMSKVELVKITPPVGQDYEGGFSFLKTVQPVLDRHCIGCHGLKSEKPKNVNLLSTQVPEPWGQYPGNPQEILLSTSYSSLIKQPGMVKLAQRNSEKDFSTPKDYFAHAGKLANMLLNGHEVNGKKNVNLSKEELSRIFDWLDVNAQYYGDYSWNRVENSHPDTAGETALREQIKKDFGEELASQPYEALVNVANPEESRILKAPLSEKDNGWGQVEKGFSSAQDERYQNMKKLVAASIQPMAFTDLQGTCNRTPCTCGNCWIRVEKANIHTNAVVEVSSKK